MNDIVERLRTPLPADDYYTEEDTFVSSTTAQEAADEIERLRAAINMIDLTDYERCYPGAPCGDFISLDAADAIRACQRPAQSP